jgi:sortase A
LIRTRPSPVRAVLRFVASVMITSGLLLISDAGLTLAWQEPISAYLNGRQQTELKRKLENPVVIARVKRRHPLRGDAIGKIVLPRLGKSYYVVEGTDASSLKKGPGHYPDTPLPGKRGTIGIAGHRTTHGAPFRHIDDMKKGDRVVVEMPYGTYTYRVQKTRIVDDSAISVKRSVGYQRLILSACHPLYSAAQRIVVFARFSKQGPPKVVR